MKPAEPDESEQVKIVDELLKANIDLIPVDKWGFDDETKEKMRNRKHRIVNSLLSRAERKRLSNSTKHLMAREVGGSFQTVTEVFGWLKHFSKGARPTKRRPEDEKSESAAPAADEGVSEGGNTQTVDGAEPEMIKRKKIGKDPVPVSALWKVKDELISGAEKDSEDIHLKDEIEHLGNASTSRIKRKAKDQPKAVVKKKRSEMDPVKSQEDDKIDLPKLPPLTDRSLALQKLQAKIEHFKSLRRGKKTPEQYEDFRKAKRRLSKIKMREKRKKEKQSKSSESKEKDREQKSDVKKDLGVPNDLMKDGDKIVYSKFDFLVKDKPKKLTKTERRDKFTGKNFKVLLEKAEKRAERIEKIRERDPEKAEHIEENILWNKVMSRTEGKKVKDDPFLLKKGLIKKEKTKEKRKRKWEQRNDFVKRKQEQEQEKRKANIQARKDMKLRKKLERARKKGRIS